MDLKEFEPLGRLFMRASISQPFYGSGICQIWLMFVPHTVAEHQPMYVHPTVTVLPIVIALIWFVEPFNQYWNRLTLR